MKVSVLMITYYHEEFIEAAINGVLMQDCNFSFELIVADDNSPDQTVLVVDKLKRQHLKGDIIKYTKHQKNKGANSNLLWALKQSKGEYIAICEGDDYWTDPLKLQKQVDFLEQNPDYGLTHSDVNHFYQNTGKLVKAFNKKNNIKIPNGNILTELYYRGYIIKTMTTCFRRDILQKHYLNDPVIMANIWKLIDLSIWLVFAYHSKIKYMDEVFVTYRLLPESMSRSKDPRKIYDFHTKIHNILYYFSTRYNANDDMKYSIKIRRIKSELFDGINLNDKDLIFKSYNRLKKNGGRLNLKEKIIYTISRIRTFKSLFRVCMLMM